LHSFLEGPCLDRNGDLWMVDIAHGRILRVSVAGEWDVMAEYDGWPTGLKIRDDGAIFVADNRLGIVRFDRPGMTPRVVCPGDATGQFLGVNDLHFAPNGDLYFTDQGASDLARPVGRVFCLKTDGVLKLVAGGFPSPNGLVLTPDGEHLYVAVTQGNAIWRVTLLRNGAIGCIGLFVQLSGSYGGGPDGLTIGPNESLIVAHPYLGSVWVFSRNGEPLYRIRSCAGPAPTNVCVSGTDRRCVFITESESGCVLRADLPHYEVAARQ